MAEQQVTIDVPCDDRGVPTVYRDLITPRGEEEDAEQVPEYRNVNKTDHEVWDEMKSKYPFLAEAADSIKKFSAFCAPRSYGQLQDNGRRRDFSHLAQLAEQ